MKIIQVSDLHIDSKMETNFTISQAKQRNNEILVTFENLFNVMENEDYQAMLIVGDMFDTKKMSSKSFSYIIELIKKHSSKLFFYVPGNHDQEANLIKHSDLPNNLKVFDEEFSKYNLNENIVVGGIKLTETNTLTLSKQIDFEKNKLNILMLHGELTKQSNKVNNETIFIGDIKNKNIDYLALGHIHSYSTNKIDDRCMSVYSGCLEPRGFDEFGDKGYVSILIDEQSKKITHKFVKFQSRTFHNINIDITDLENSRQILELIYKNLKDIKNDDIIKITLTGKFDANITKGIDLIESELSRQYYFVKIIDKSKLKINIEDYKSNFTLKGIFIRQVLESKKIPEELKDEVIITGIKALEKEEID